MGFLKFGRYKLLSCVINLTKGQFPFQVLMGGFVERKMLDDASS